MEQYSVFDCSILEFDKHHSERKGNLTVVENGNTLPFDVKRAYYMYDIPSGAERGGHAHKTLFQLIFAASGSFDVILSDGRISRIFTLNRPYQGLLVYPGMWRELVNFSSGSVCCVLASDVYDASDYIRDFQEFKRYRNDSSSI